MGHAGLFAVDDAVELAMDVSLLYWVLYPVGSGGGQAVEDGE